MTEFVPLIVMLADTGVEFIVVGGVAGALHGSARSTRDLDVVYRRTPENILRIVHALERHRPYPRGAPPGLPFRWDEQTVAFGSNFTLVTDAGAIDILGEITGGGAYEQLLPYTDTLCIANRACLCLNLAKLIAVKRAAGRPKDYEAVAELEAIREEQERSGR